MPKQIILIRHAQTAGKQAGQGDYDRLLTPDGEVQAKNIGHMLIRNTIQPDILISSNAVRARQTALLINESTRLPAANVWLMDSLYEAEMATWLDLLHQLDEVHATVICVGHNPVISCLASVMAKRTIDLAPAATTVFQSNSLSWPTVDRDLREIPLQPLPA